MTLNAFNIIIIVVVVVVVVFVVGMIINSIILLVLPLWLTCYSSAVLPLLKHNIKPNLNKQFQCDPTHPRQIIKREKTTDISLSAHQVQFYPTHPGQLIKRKKAADISQGALQCVISVPNGLSAEKQQPVQDGTNTKKITGTHTSQDSASTNNNISGMSYTGKLFFIVNSTSLISLV